MMFYSFFLLNLGLIAYHIFRSRKVEDRILLFVLSSFLVFTLAVHPWIWRSTSMWLRVLENLVLMGLAVWLIGKPLSIYGEKKRRNKRSLCLLEDGKGPLFEIVQVCRMLSEAKQGGLIAIERKDSLESWIKPAIPLLAKVRKETIFSIFTPPGALHDGGIIIQRDLIAAAGVVFPLSKRVDLPTELGTRHRAGLGLSEATDALTIIISEETGKVSLADRGSLLYDVKSEKLPQMIETALRNRLVRKKRKTIVSKDLRREKILQ